MPLFGIVLMVTSVAIVISMEGNLLLYIYFNVCVLFLVATATWLSATVFSNVV